MGVAIFYSEIFSYLSFLLSVFKPYHGKDPRKKYIRTYPIASKSSRLLYSMYFIIIIINIIIIIIFFILIFKTNYTDS